MFVPLGLGTARGSGQRFTALQLKRARPSGPDNAILCYRGCLATALATVVWSCVYCAIVHLTTFTLVLVIFGDTIIGRRAFKRRLVSVTILMVLRIRCATRVYYE